MQYRNKSERPVVAPPQFENLPESLKVLANWVLWRFDWNLEKERWAKVPYRAWSEYQERASVNLFSDWTKLHQAERNFKNWFDALYDGIGFVFTADAGITGIDLDDCVKWENDRPVFNKWALAILKKVGDSYVEFSPSRTGLHILVKAGIEKAIKFKYACEGHPDAAVEIYDRDRYFCLTGDIYNGEEPREAQSEIDEIIKGIEEARKKNHLANGGGSHVNALGDSNEKERENHFGVSNRPKAISAKTASERIAIAINSQKGKEIEALFNGDITGFDDQSTAEMALCRYLCFYSEGSSDMLREMMILSRLYRMKWDREIKSTGEIYIDYTIRRCLETETNFWTPPIELSQAKSAPADFEAPRPNRFTLKELKDEAIAYKYQPDILGLSCGWKNFDEVYRPRPGLLSVWIGEPGSGKSTFVKAYLYKFCLQNALRCGMAEFETKPLVRALHDLVRLRYHAPTFTQFDGCVSDDDFAAAIDELDPYFFLMAPRKGERNVQGLSEIVMAEKRDRSQDVLYLDPFTQLQSAQRLQLKYTDFISDQLQTLVEDTDRLNLISHLIVHPVKGFNRHQGLRFSDANGSGDFERVADYGLVVTAEHVGSERRTVIELQKLRDDFTGQANGKAAFVLDQASYLFSSAQVPIRIKKGEDSEIPF